MSRTYVYCVVRGGDEPPLAGAPAGVPGAGPLRALPAGEGLWLVVADVPPADYDAEAIARGLDDLAWVSERALGHERVVEHLADPAGERGAARAVLPLKLFTLFDSDERARRWAAAEAGRLAARLDRLAGRVEIGVRVRWLAPPAEAGVAAADRPASGTDFLRAKRRRRDERRERAAAAVGSAAAAFDELAAAADEARRRPPPPEAGALLLDAVFLVAAGAGVAAFEERADAVARSLAAAGCELTVTGPWPPYHFVEAGG